MGSPVLVADTPVFHVERLRRAVRSPLAGELADGEVAIFHPVTHLFHGAGAGVGADERLAADFPAPLHEFVGAEGVGILDLPCLVPDALPVGADSILPVVGGHETAARPADDRDLQLTQGLDDVLAESIFVGKGIAGAEHPAVDLVVEMLQEASEYHGIVLDPLRAGLDSDRVLGGKRGGPDKGHDHD